MMKNYKITFNLDTPISFIDVPTFDGLLAYAFAKRKLGRKFGQKLSYSKDEIIDFTAMPIAMHQNGWFIASSMMWDKTKTKESIERWRKRWSTKDDQIADFGKKQRKVDTTRGEFKSYDTPFVLKDIKQVWFYFASSNIEEVNKLIETYISHIGKKRAYGHGEILDFEIKETKFNFEAEIYRPMPRKLAEVKNMTSIRFQFCGYKPPYWLPDNMEECVVPN